LDRGPIPPNDTLDEIDALGQARDTQGIGGGGMLSKETDTRGGNARLVPFKSNETT
jgi:hypothetical protein